MFSASGQFGNEDCTYERAFICKRPSTRRTPPSVPALHLSSLSREHCCWLHIVFVVTCRGDHQNDDKSNVDHSEPHTSWYLSYCPLIAWIFDAVAILLIFSLAFE